MNRFLLLFCTVFLAQTAIYAEELQTPPCFSGIYPSLAMFNDDGECGTGTVVAWADRLWATTYGPHSPHGSSDKLYEITPELKQIVRSESVGGTHANRLIHRESKQLVIGPYLIDEQRNVRAVSPKVMPGRLTATARHLTDPENKVYFATMEEGLYEVDVKTLAVKNFIKDGNPIKKGYTDEAGISTFQSQLPGYHGKGSYSGQGRLVYAQNGDRDERVQTDPTTPSGALAEWKMKGDWQLIRRNQFTEVTGPGGIIGNEHPDTDPIWSIGWDYRSLILMVLDGGQWTAYRLPKASHTYDSALGHYTEWPRIRDIGGEYLLMTMHGTFWRFPKTFTPKNSAGIEPRSTYLKVIGDFCRWNDRIVCGCDDSAKSEFMNKRKIKGNLSAPGRSQSNLWFIKPEQLDNFGPKIGRGCPWVHDTVKANEYSEPYLFAGYEHRQLFLRHGNSEPVTVSMEMDAKGDGNYQVYKTVAVPAEGIFVTFDKDVPGVWIRLKTDKAAADMTAMFHYRGDDNRTKQYAEKFDGLAQLGDENICGGVMLARGGGFKTLRLVAQNTVSNSQDGEFGPYDLDGDLTLKKQDDPEGLKWTKEHAAIPAGVLQYDEASVLLVDEKGRWRLPKGDKRRDKPGILGEERVCREVATERDLLHAHGTFYELPADNAGGVQKIRPIASHPFRIKDYASYRGMLVVSGIKTNVSEGSFTSNNSHIIKSDDDKCAVWCGVIDDLWELGKPRGIGGPWKDSEVKANEPSDPYLMTGYDKKRIELSHHSTEPVVFRIELDVCGDGQWSLWKTVSVAPNKTEKLDIPVDAYWVRLVSDKSATVSAVFEYE
ncbi:MAG: hypothetical protein LBN39_02000 [Planctomycetaceae bacterium]|jgi:hypothetical protein|nr:hypothetical protein [Planctomycetaceae bacterium]